MQETPFPSGKILESRYRLISGQPGDLGVVYQAQDLQNGQPVVVLVLSSRLPAGAEALSHLQAIQQTVVELAQPGLVPYRAAGLVDGRIYAVRDTVAGTSLAEILVREGPLPVPQAVELAARLCDVLAPLHRAGLVHGSLSAHSILIEKERGVVSVVDVGLLPALRPDHAGQRQPWGRSPYLSPEQGAGENVRPASDVYVIGSLLYAMLSGRPPFRASDEAVLALQHLRQEPPSLAILVPGIPGPIAEIVHRALSKEPAARYRNAGQLAHTLRAHAPQHAPETAGAPSPQAPSPGMQVQHMIVPPPPPPAHQAGRPVHKTYLIEEGAEEDWDTEPRGLDCLTVVLIALALIAVLGLIPLWRSVYRRYAAPAALSVPDAASARAEPEPELEPSGFLWYNKVFPFRIGQSGPGLGAASCKQTERPVGTLPIKTLPIRILPIRILPIRILPIGILLKEYWVLESSLRVFGPSYYKLSSSSSGGLR